MKGMINELIYYVDPKDILDHLKEGAGLRVRIWGPRREYIQVAVCPRSEMPKAALPPELTQADKEPTAEPEVRREEDLG